MTKKTDIDGTVNETTGKYGPYLQAVPVNPFNNSNLVTDDPTETAKGWYYNKDTGVFRANDGGDQGGVDHSEL
jgi:hypothetical protein